MSVDDRIQSIIDATFADKTLGKRAARKAPDKSEVLKSIASAPGGVTQPAMSMGPGRNPEREAKRQANPERLTKNQRRLDELQLGLDAVGIFEPTPFADGTNAAISLGRAVKEPGRRKEHLKNAAISAVSMIPYAGDLAKLAKTPRAAKTLKNFGKAGDYVGNQARGMRQDRFESGVLGGSGGGGSGEGNDGEGRGRWRRSGRRNRGSQSSGSGGGGGVVPPITPSSGAGAGDDPRKQEEANRELDKWTDKLKRSGEKILTFAGPVGAIVAAFIVAVKSIERTNSGILLKQHGLADFNGNIASAYAKLEAEEVRRKIRKGEALDGPVSALTEEQSELRDHMARWTNPIEALSTQVAAWKTEMLNLVLSGVESLPPIASTLWAIEKILKDDSDNKGTAWEQLIEDMRDGKLDGRKPEFEGSGTTNKNNPSAADIASRPRGVY